MKTYKQVIDELVDGYENRLNKSCEYDLIDLLNDTPFKAYSHVFGVSISKLKKDCKSTYNRKYPKRQQKERDYLIEKYTNDIEWFEADLKRAKNRVAKGMPLGSISKSVLAENPALIEECKKNLSKLQKGTYKVTI